MKFNNVLVLRFSFLYTLKKNAWFYLFLYSQASQIQPQPDEYPRQVQLNGQGEGGTTSHPFHFSKRNTPGGCGIDCKISTDCMNLLSHLLWCTHIWHVFFCCLILLTMWMNALFMTIWTTLSRFVTFALWEWALMFKSSSWDWLFRHPACNEENIFMPTKSFYYLFLLGSGTCTCNIAAVALW